MPILSPVGMEFVADHIAANRFASSENISEVLDTEQPGGGMAAPSTVRRSLRRNNYRFGRPVRKFVLKEAAKNSRLVWGIQHRQFEFDRVVFADEACFALGPDGRVMFWYPRDDKTLVEVPHYPASCTFSESFRFSEPLGICPLLRRGMQQRLPKEWQPTLYRVASDSSQTTGPCSSTMLPPTCQLKHSRIFSIAEYRRSCFNLPARRT